MNYFLIMINFLQSLIYPISTDTISFNSKSEYIMFHNQTSGKHTKDDITQQSYLP